MSGRIRGRRLLRVVLIVVLLLGVAAVAVSHLLTSRYAWARAVTWQQSDVGDQFRFPSRVIPAGRHVSALPRGPEPAALKAPVSLGMTMGSLETFLRGTGTRAFLVVHHDRLVYERYFGGATHDDRQTSFSSAKSFLSTLVGIATDEGLIEDVEDPVTAYVPELARRDRRFSHITIRDLLTMSSGIRYEEHGLPWSDDALTYYATDLRDLALTHTEIDDVPGRTWHYDNYNPLLLGLVLERATGTSVSHFMSTRLWQPLGAEGDATWSLDSRQSGFEKMESGVNALPVDYARFGVMMLHGGRWNGRQIVSRKWVAEATSDSRRADPADFYQYMWWVGPPGDGGQAPFYARGRYGQIVAVFPDEDTVIVRLGSADAGVDWQARLREVAERIAAGE